MKVYYNGNAPYVGSKMAAGADLISKEDYTIKPGEQILLNTGTRVQLEEGTFGMLLPRSSLCNKKGLMMANSMGVIDADYRGEIMCCYRNIGNEEVSIPRGERICQLIVMHFIKPEYEETEELDATERGDGGFGSTGK